MGGALILGGLVALLLFSSANQKKKLLDQIKLTVKDIAINKNKTKLLTTAFQIKLGLKNPNPIDLTFPTAFIAADLFRGNNPIAQVSTPVSINIPGTKEQEIKIPVEVSNLSLVNELLDLVKPPKKSKKGKKTAPQNPPVTIKGNLTYSGVMIPFQKTLNLI